MNIGILVGSLRKDSYNRKIAENLIKLAPTSLNIKFIDISQLTFFNEDQEANPPQAWVKFREDIKPLEGVLFVTPEYNRSTAPALKNALDIGSRPYGQNLWQNKPCAVVSASMGAQGGFGANHHLRQSLVFLNMPCLQQPEVYLGAVDKLFNEQGVLQESTQTFLKKFMEVYADWVQKHPSK